MIEIIEKLTKILEDICPGRDILGKDDLVDSGVLDSLDIVTLVTEINDCFGVSVSAEDMIPENFNSIEAMAALVAKLDG